MFGLSIRKTPSPNLDENSNSNISPPQLKKSRNSTPAEPSGNVPANEEHHPLGKSDYASSIFLRYKRGNRNSKPIGLRKFTSRRGHGPLYAKSKREGHVYEALKKHEGWEKYIIPFERAGATNDYSYLNFKYEEGDDLFDVLKVGKLSEAEMREMLAGIADALRFVVAAGYIHGDLKVDNIYVAKGGRPLLLDFADAERDPSNRAIRKEFDNFVEMAAVGFKIRKSEVEAAIGKDISEVNSLDELEAAYRAIASWMRGNKRDPFNRRGGARRYTRRRKNRASK